MIYGFFYLIACLVIASTGINKKIGYFGTLIISLLLSPVIGLIVALVSKEKNPVERFREIAIKSKNKQDYIIAIRNIQKALSIEPSNPKLVYDLACYYSVIGNKVDAINALIRAVELGYSNFPQIDCDPDLSNIRKTDEFHKLRKTNFKRIYFPQSNEVQNNSEKPQKSAESKFEKLQRLALLKLEGKISENEFQIQKKKIIDSND